MFQWVIVIVLICLIFSGCVSPESILINNDTVVTLIDGSKLDCQQRGNLAQTTTTCVQRKY